MKAFILSSFLAFLAASAHALNMTSSGGGCTTDCTMSSLTTTGTAPSLTATGAVFTGSVTVTGTNGANVGGPLVVGGPFTTSRGTATIRSATDVPQLGVIQSNSADGWQFHAEESFGDLRFLRFASGVGSEAARLKTDGLKVQGWVLVVGTGTSIQGSLTVNSTASISGGIVGGLGVSGAFTTSVGSVTIRPATDVPQLYLQQQNGTDGWQTHADSSTGDITFYRRESGANTERIRFAATGGIRVSATGSTVVRILKTATASTDLGGAITATCTAETNFSITGVAVGDSCTVTTPAAIGVGDWVVCRTLVDNVALKYCTQGVSIDPAAMVYHITTIEY